MRRLSLVLLFLITGAATLLAQTPLISGFSPVNGSIGTLITISGTNLNNSTGINIGGANAITISNSATEIVAMVMPGAVTGSVSVSTAGGTAAGTANFTVIPGLNPNFQRGKLVGTGSVGSANQGFSVAISANGETAIVGGNRDNSVGAVWIYTKINNVWTQQGNKLTGTGGVGNSLQGSSVALSADGNTAIVGGYADNSNLGAVWVFTRSAGVWTQQGVKLSPSGQTGTSVYFGFSVSLSADGNTAMIGGYFDASGKGAAWVFKRTGNTWSQMGSKLTGSVFTGTPNMGRSVAISADGSTGIIGGANDASGIGAAWVFTQSGGIWTEQGSRLVGTSYVGSAQQGSAVALSADGNTAIVGGYTDNASKGASWIYTRSSGVWTQQGSKIASPLSTGSSNFGSSVSLSADGNTAIIGSRNEDTGKGAAYVFIRSQNLWTQYNTKLVGSPSATTANQGGAVAISADGNSAILGGITDGGGLGASWVFDHKPLPQINSFSPTGGGTGQSVSISGKNFTDVTGISFGGVSASSFNVSSDSTASAIVGEGSSGDVRLTVSNGFGSLAGFIYDSPTISSFAPLSGAAGTLITVKGANFGGLLTLKIGGVNALVLSKKIDEIVAMVMPGATNGLISLTTASGSVQSSSNFQFINRYPTLQQGNKLVGTGNVGAGQQGYSVALSADGTTAIVGAYADNSNQGGVWIYTLISGYWTQQGNKLTGTGNIGAAQQGISVALSADGNTAVIGGSADNTNIGAIWAFTRSNGIWSQQGAKLVGTGYTGTPQQGRSVALSADGNTVLVGGYHNSSQVGASWVFVRTNGVWAQQGTRLTAIDAVGAAAQGFEVALSSDGNTAVIGGYRDNTSRGAVWVFVRSGTTWAQQGSKLVGTGVAGTPQVGYSVAVSADGNTLLFGGNSDNSNAGAVWVYSRTGTTWTQQGNKLIGSGSTGAVQQGSSIALSADGNTALIGTPLDNSGLGATWIFTRSGTVWTQLGNKLVGTGSASTNARQGTDIALSANGTTALIGANADDSNKGAAWVFRYIPAPVITSFTPDSAGVGDIVTIRGSSFAGTQGVTFGGSSAASFTAATDTLISAVVGPGGTGHVGVIAPQGTAVLAGFVFPQSTINSISPLNGPVGTIVTISGLNLSSSETIQIAGVNALIISNSGTELKAMVMPGAVSGPVSIGAVSSIESFTVSAPLFPNVQVGNKLLGTGNIGAARQGYSVAISGDGNTAVVSGTGDNTAVGAVWIYTKTNGVWAQQGNKLVGTGYSAQPNQGTSVAISADGNTVLVGGYADASGIGAVWVFVRNGSVWSQQGNKLVGSGSIGSNGFQGYSVSLSADGNTAIWGAYQDNSSIGAAWIFERKFSVWKQMGNKLVGTGYASLSQQGYSVAMSSDGQTAAVGGHFDSSGAGAAWVYVRNGNNWVQQGSKLLATGNVGTAGVGKSMALSADGNRLIIGGSQDNSSKGAIWVFERNAGVWSQQGNKLVGSGAVGSAQLGSSLSINAEGNSIMAGGRNDNSSFGAYWLFTKSGAQWSQQGDKITGTGSIGNAQQGYSVSMSADGSSGFMGALNDNSNQGTAFALKYVVPPVITSFSPDSTGTGTVVNIVGSSFTNTSIVKFGGEPASSFNVVSDSLISAVVGKGKSGTVSITAPQGTATMEGFKFPPPSISAVLPLSGDIGTLLTITGNNFYNGIPVIVGGVNTITISNNGSTIVVMVMPGTVSGSITVGSASSADNFTLIDIVPNSQDGNKLLGTDTEGASRQGSSVAVSADGKTAVVGGYADKNNQGAVWVYTKINEQWVQQSNKLVGTGAVGTQSQQGSSISLSADGNTFIVGAPSDNAYIGAAWIFTRNGNTWTQQGSKLTPVGSSGIQPRFGTSVAISADGNTAIVGAWFDSNGIGATWVFVRNEGLWVQQGNKLTGTGYSSYSYQGTSVALSGDGNTAIVGGDYDNTNIGASWIFTRTGNTWAQQGDKLVGTGYTGSPAQGTSVALSVDGNTAIVGGLSDGGSKGAVWVFTRNNNVWTQNGDKLTGQGIQGNWGSFGKSVSLNAGGNLALVGGNSDNTNIGAIWLFKRINSKWVPLGDKIIGTGNVGIANIGHSVSLSADGSTAVAGGLYDNNYLGSTWVFKYILPPTVSSFTPTNAAMGDTVVIKGARFTGATKITFGGVRASSFNVVSDTLIRAIVGIGGTGEVAITGRNGTGSLAGFTYPQPVISSISPKSGRIGSVISISGTNFGALDTINIGGVNAIILSNTGTLAKALVMPGSSSGNVSLRGVLSPDNFTLLPAAVPNTQDGNKLVDGTTLGSQQGYSVSISADGSTALVGGLNYSSNAGTVWFYVLQNGLWVQQGNKVYGNLASGYARIGYSASISADGNTALVGGNYDNSGIGAAWVFTRNNGVWTQQGKKLIGTGYVGLPEQGSSVSISADGNTAIIGGSADNNEIGAAWIFSRNDGLWTQVGDKLIGSGFTGSPRQGYSVTISADAKTAAIGGFTSDSGQGGVWIFVNNNGNWVQQGVRVIGTGNVNSASQGVSIALSADGNTLISGGYSDNSSKGAAWIFTRNEGNWTQQGDKLVGTQNTDILQQGRSVSISADGNTAIVGGYHGYTGIGAIWTYKRTGNIWSQQGERLSGSGGVGNSSQGQGIALSADGTRAIVGGYRDNSSMGAAWIFKYVPKPIISSFSPVNAGSGASVTVRGSGFTDLTSLSFGGVAASSFTVTADTLITAVVGAGATGDLIASNPVYADTLSEFKFLSGNANLSSLMIPNVNLSPSFDSGIFAYTDTVDFGTAAITVTPTSTDSTATIKVNGSPVLSGFTSAGIPLNLGENTIVIQVTAEDSTKIKTYVVSVTRQVSANADMASLSLSSGILSPVFASGTISYTASVENETASITITPSAAESNATLKVNGTTVSSGSPTAAIPLLVGDNIIGITLTAQDGTTTKTYTITVNRAVPLFPYNESFRNTSVAGMVYGGTPNMASLTATSIDANGTGYLRLTNNGASQSGFARNTKAFPTANGLSVTFEYYTYGGSGGDGLSFFLYDASANSAFQIGAAGGSLGYAQTTNSGGLPGVSKGYLGIGLDEFGNFSNPTAGRQGGPGARASGIALRGDGNGLAAVATNYEYLTGIQTSNAAAMTAAGAGTAFQIAGMVNGRTGNVTGRPQGGLLPTETGYRKAKVELTPNGLGTGFILNVWITEGNAGTSTVHQVVTNYSYIGSTVPQFLSYGFTASTGGSNNFHEVRNLAITVPQAGSMAPFVADVNKSGSVNTVVPFTALNFSEKFSSPGGNPIQKVKITSLPGSGTLKLNGVDVILNQEININDIGQFNYTPSSNFTGAVSFGWNGTDNTVYAVNNAIVSLNIAPAGTLSLPYSESFRNSTASNMVYGGTTAAVLTASSGTDTEGAGYLRLTSNAANQNGFARNTTSLPTADGLNISFEYYTYGGTGADGLTFFLYDATANSAFQIGAPGGSLGYAQNSTLPGVSKGYLGFGFDEFGNFSTATAGRQGGPGQKTSSLTIRGDGNGLGAGSPAGSNYEFLTNVQTSNAAQMTALNAGTAFLIGGNVNGRSLGSEGLGISNTGYRKAQIELKPNGLGTGFIVNVWITEGSASGGVIHQVVKDLNYAGTSVPANLSYGFAGSTGGSTNFHEIRNLNIRVPGTFTIPSMMAIKENIFEGFMNKFSTNQSNNDESKELNATNLISPNGDGKNDTWVIRNIEKYPNNIVRVFDRLGRLVYSASNYNNAWDGIYQGALLPEDTYYYIIELPNGGGQKRGYISIVR